MSLLGFVAGHHIMVAKKNVVCQQPACASVMTQIQSFIFKRLSSILAEKGIKLEVADSGPSLVIVNNTSRINSDVERDIKKTGELKYYIEKTDDFGEIVVHMRIN